MSNVIAYHSGVDKVMVVDTTSPQEVARLVDSGDWQFFRVQTRGQAVSLQPLRSRSAAEVTESRVVSAELEDTPGP